MAARHNHIPFPRAELENLMDCSCRCLGTVLEDTVQARDGEFPHFDAIEFRNYDLKGLVIGDLKYR